MALTEERTAIARAIWNIRREDEDRCDIELEDLGNDHSVWREADAAIAAMPKPDPIGTVAYGAFHHVSIDWHGALPKVGTKLYTEAPIAHPASAPSEQKLECPYPCGWENLYSLIVSNGALIVRSIDPDSVSDSTWAAISNTIEHAKELCKHGMSNHDYKAQRDALMGVLNKARNALVQWHVPENRYSAIESIDAAIVSVKGGA